MALGAMANNPSVQVKIVPVGLSYFHAHRFRSRAVIEFGAAMDVPLEYVAMFKEGGAQKREAVSKFLDLIYDGLKTVTVQAPDYDTLMVSFRMLFFVNWTFNHCFKAHPSRPAPVQNARTTFNTRPGCGAQ
jgi:1-acyl-sn-glycerol-3-phosphate acyltransferase